MVAWLGFHTCRAARSQNYDELKKAQERADFRKAYTGEQEEETKITIQLATQVVSFLLSENGAFLKEALINELVCEGPLTSHAMPPLP